MKLDSFSEYQTAATETFNPDQAHRERITNFAMGLAGETGELVDALKKELFHGRPLDPNSFISEAGDILWYLTGLCTQRGVSLAEVAAANIDKLAARYPDGFVKGGGIRG